MTDLKAIPLTYGLGANDLINVRFKRIAEIKKIMESDEIDFSIIDKIKSCDCDEIPNVISTISSFINSDIELKKFISLTTVFKAISNIITERSCYNTDISDKLTELVSKITDTYNEFYSKNEITAPINNEITQCISILKSIIYKCKNINEKAEVVNLQNINQIKCASCNESILLSTDSHKIYSENSPNGTNVVGINTFQRNPSDLLSDIINVDSDEQLIHRLPNLKKYFNMYKLSITGDEVERIEDLIKYIYDVLITNNTGLYKLQEVLYDIVNTITDVKVDNFDSHESIQNLYDFLRGYIDKIQNRMASNESDHVDFENDIMTEFGFGFLYEYPENMTLTEANSFAREFNSIPDDQMSDFMNSLTEMVDEYKREEKMRRKAEKREQRSRDRDTIKYKGRVLTLTNGTARNALSSIKRIIGGVVAGGATAVISPQLGAIVGALSIISAFCKSKLTPSTEKKRLILDLKSELRVVEEKIAQMDRAGDVKNKARLMRMQDKMQELYNRLSFTLHSGDLV